MQLFVYITNQEQNMSPILSSLAREGVSGGTLVDCKGLLPALEEANIEPPPIFGSLRQFLNPEHKAGKMLLIVLRDEDIAKVKEIIHAAAGDLKQPNTGILFTVPVMNWEGVPHK